MYAPAPQKHGEFTVVLIFYNYLSFSGAKYFLWVVYVEMLMKGLVRVM